jgi:hypothetical protein
VGRRAIAVIYPCGLENHPGLAGMQSPVTVEHSIIKCPRCERDCWIGPAQRRVVKLGGAEALCVLCMIIDEEVCAQEVLPTIALNPDIDNVPRRFPR